MSTARLDSLTSPLRVLMLSADYAPDNWSGIGVAVATQAQSLAALGVHVEVLSAAPATIPALSRGVRVHRLSPEHCRVRLDEFDVLHVHSLGLAELAGEMSRRSQLPLVYSAHSILEAELDDPGQAAFWGSLQRQLCRLAALTVFVSEAERQQALALLPEVAGKARVIPNGLEPCVPTPGRRGRDAARPSLLFVGRFSERKGLPLLQRILPQLVHGDGARVRLVGGHGDRSGDARISRLQSMLGEACQVVDWCSRETLAGFYAEADLLLVPSQYEPFGLVALEAMQHGCPVLAAATGGLTENVTAESGGVLVDPGDPERWLGEARRLLRDPALRRALASRGPDYVRHGYCPRRLARRWVSEAYVPAVRARRSEVEATTPIPRLSAADKRGTSFERGMQT